MKEAISAEFMAERQAQFVQQALARWRKNPNIHLLGNLEAHRIPIFSFIVTDEAGLPVPHNFFSRGRFLIYMASKPVADVPVPDLMGITC